MGKGQLATVRLIRKNMPKLSWYKEALVSSKRRMNQKSVATAWHQIGMVHQEAGDYEKAEAAYRRSLEIETQNNDRAGQASSLNQLGNLYR